MYSELLKTPVLNAINRYLSHLPTQTLEINTAIATRTLPVLLETLIKEEILRAEVSQIRNALSQLYRTQLHAKERMLRAISRDEIAVRCGIDAREINLLNEKIRTLEGRVWHFTQHLKAETAPNSLLSDLCLFGVYPDEQRNFLLKEIATFSMDLQSQLLPLVNKIYSYLGDWKYPKYKHSETANYYINTLLIKMHWAKEIRACHQEIMDLRKDLDTLEKEHHELHFVLTSDPALTDYVQMRKLLYIENSREFDLQVERIKRLYNFERLDKADFKDIFHQFVNALRPLVQHNEHFFHALEELDRVPNRMHDLRDRKFTILKILHEQKLKPVIQESRGKKMRIDDLIARIKNIEINEKTDLHAFVRTIISWESASINGKTNTQVFNPTNLHKFFHPDENNIGHFINQCVALVSPEQTIVRYRSQNIDPRSGTLPRELAFRQVEMF